YAVNAKYIRAKETTSIVVSSTIGEYGGTTNLSATLSSNSAGVAGKIMSFSLNGNAVGTAVSDESGVATLSNVSLAGIDANTYVSGIIATFGGDVTHSGSSGDSDLIINKAPLTVTANDDTKVYDGLAYSGGNGVEYDGFVNGE